MVKMVLAMGGEVGAGLAFNAVAVHVIRRCERECPYLSSIRILTIGVAVCTHKTLGTTRRPPIHRPCRRGSTGNSLRSGFVDIKETLYRVPHTLYLGLLNITPSETIPTKWLRNSLSITGIWRDPMRRHPS